MSVVVLESDIPGSSLKGRNPSEVKNNKLRFWLINAVMIPPKVYAQKPKLLSGKLVLFHGCDVNIKTDKPNMTPTVRAICTFAVYFSAFRPFCRFTLVYEWHFVLCYKEKTKSL